MVLLVQKYGGSSLTDLSKLEIIAKKVKSYQQAGYQLVVVLSAMQGETDRLIELSTYMNQTKQAREYDALLATGEQITTSMMAMALERLGVRARSFNAEQAGIHSDGKFTRAAITRIKKDNIMAWVEKGVIPVITGFQGIGADGSVTTLGRGGSDVTAVAIAAALNADECQIFVDVHGVYTADPKIVSHAKLLHQIPASKMHWCAMLGAKVIQKRAVSCAEKYKVAVRILSTYREGPGTMININTNDNIESTTVLAVAHQKDQLLCELDGFPNDYELALSLLNELNNTGLELFHEIRIKQDLGLQLIFSMSESDYQLFKQVTSQWFEQYGVVLTEKCVKKKAKVSLVGYLLSRDLNITGQLLSICKEASIQIWQLSATDTKISLLVDQAKVEWLIRALHETLIENKDQVCKPDRKLSLAE